MAGSYDPSIYDATIPASLLGDVEWYRRKARECGGPVLELGAGTGRVALRLGRDGIAVHALDCNAEMLGALRRKVEAELTRTFLPRLELSYLYPSDIRRLLADAGFRSIDIHDGFDERPFQRDTDELVVEAGVD